VTNSNNFCTLKKKKEDNIMDGKGSCQYYQDIIEIAKIFSTAPSPPSSLPKQAF
jgi:hypothetical protein